MQFLQIVLERERKHSLVERDASEEKHALKANGPFTSFKVEPGK